MNQEKRKKRSRAKPRWLKRRIPAGGEYETVRRLLGESGLHTVCQEAQCPNLWECFTKHTATFMILGSRCTRNCRFCAVGHGPSGAPDPGEPARVAKAAHAMKLRYVVVTSVTRDDLPDGGAGIFAETIRAIRDKNPDALVEVLTPDFQGDEAALRTVLEARPDVLNHNIETVERLYPSVRPEAVYQRSLDFLRRASLWTPAILTKSGVMLGLGETDQELRRTMADLLKSGCAILTLGQYLQPTKAHLPVHRYVPPEEFERWRKIALDMGFSEAASGPFVRSSYHARESYDTAASVGS
ncbi:MAG: lipoyl synthase [Desulfobacterales bacterium]|nr:lipoyl synthase [Desulfobacterales bacterium]